MIMMQVGLLHIPVGKRRQSRSFCGPLIAGRPLYIIVSIWYAYSPLFGEVLTIGKVDQVQSLRWVGFGYALSPDLRGPLCLPPA
jgi:hypothetical protein